MNVSKKYQKLLADRGIILGDLGFNDIALRRADALEAVTLLRKELISVLGGDVYYRQNSRTSIAYANWYCEPNAGEDIQDFVSRSCDKATEYIGRFPDLTGKEALFVLVVRK